MKPVILVFTAGYVPGYRWGGPVRSIANLVHLLGDEYNFKIIAADRDLGVNNTYPGVVANVWSKVDKADVYYASPGSLGLAALSRILRHTHYDIIYLNGFFTYDFTIKPLILLRSRCVPKAPVIVAPRGEFSLGALGLKKIKKKTYILIAMLIKLYDDVLWQASSQYEADDIRRVLPKASISTAYPIVVAPDLVRNHSHSELIKRKAKRRGELSLVFVSRLSSKKNLDGAIRLLKDQEGDITFNIYGPYEDMEYYKQCQKLSSELVSNIKVVFHGPIEHGKVHEVLKHNDIFFFPTKGENFGHVILEALLAGCPVLLSDQTPWRNLEQLGVGWDIPLNAEKKFKDVIKYLVSLDELSYGEYSNKALQYSLLFIDNKEVLSQNRELFQRALAGF